MPDGRLERLADVIVGYSTRVAPGDRVLILGEPPGAPLLRAVFRCVLAAGGFPYMRPRLEGLDEVLLSEGDESQLEWVNPFSLEDNELADVRINVTATQNTKRLSGVDPARQALTTRANQHGLERILERAAKGEVRWVATAYPTQGRAQDARMSLAQYEEFVFRSCFLDREDPVEEWRAFSERLVRVAGSLNGKRELRLVAPGTDLTLGLEGRTWVPSLGHENLPDGEVFTGPVEDATEGTVHFTYPAVFKGREVEDVRLTFRGGEVVEATAARGQGFLEEMLGVDEGARRLGEAAFGLNDAVTVFTREALFDEKIGGTMHLALGTGYPETGALNRSGLHWDMICDLRAGSEAYLDGELVYRDGRFLDASLN